MSTRSAIIASTLLIFTAFAIGAICYPSLPAQIVSHWGMNGEPNGYLPKFWGVFLLPLIIAIVTALLFGIPKLDPLKENIAIFRKHYNIFIVAIAAFFFYVDLLMTAWNLGYRFSFGGLLAPAVAGLFFAIGEILPYTKRNWFIGIRTPWTVSDDRVWSKTHALGSSLFHICGFIALLGLLAPDQLAWFIVIPIAITVATTIIYSYVLYERYQK